MSAPAGRRGQSEVLGVVLLLAITVIGTSGVVVLGGPALDQSRDAVNVAAAEHEMTQLDAKASLVAHGDSDAQRVRFGADDEGIRTVDPDQGWINVTVRNRTDGSVDRTLENASLGAVTYERGGTTIAYQGGGVWRADDDGSVMVSPPEFHYRGTTLTLPLVLVDGEGRIGAAADVTRAGPSQPVYPNASESLSNPLTEGEIVVEIHSDYYDAWGRFFEQRTGGESTVDHGNETATVVLATPFDGTTVSAAVSSSAAGDEIDMQGSGGDPAYVDSYNSTAGDYGATQTDNGTLLTAGSVDMAGNAEIRGNVRAGGAVEMKGNSEVTGEVAWTTGFSPGGAATYASEREIDGVDTPPSIGPWVESRHAAIEADNDNGGAPITGERLDFAGGEATLTAGDYYLSEVDTDERIVLDTSGGPVRVAVGGDFTLDDGDVEVQGGGVARVFVGDDVEITGGSEVTVPGDESQRLWLYGMPEETSVTLEGNGGTPTRFVGVIYVPSSEDGDVSMKHAEVFGAVAGGEIELENGGVAHYDQALRTTSPVPAGASVPEVTYLHISTTTVEVEDD
jgi:flagellin-like protein